MARHERGLVAYAARITGDLERARDVVQETFIEYLRLGSAAGGSPPSGDPDSSGNGPASPGPSPEDNGHARRSLGEDGRVGAWLFAVCRNRALDVARKERRMSTLGEQQASARPAGGPGPARIVEDTEQQTRLLAALATLPAAQQEVVHLKFQIGFTYRQIADITGLSVSHVGVTIHNAVKALRDRLREA